jgi:hypothetical protein
MSEMRAQETDQPRLHTNEAYVQEVTRTTRLAIDDPMAVFAFVLGSLPERVRVYPTENHYYFSFLHNGTRYSGNIKIDARLREDGKAIFVYYEEESAWRKNTPSYEVVLDASRGVGVEKINRLEYRVAYRGRSVTFVLNDVSAAKPPAGTLFAGEEFIGPVFDESAVKFFLVFNKRLKLFLYFLDETGQRADTMLPATGNDRILIGNRTGFAFYRDHHLDRKILIGVFADNVVANNQFDGPSDQIPDNFIEGEALRNAIVAVAPDLEGRIDRFGTTADGARYAITPYMFYRTRRDLDMFHRCATSKRIPASSYHRCFVLAGGRTGKARPLATQRNRR